MISRFEWMHIKSKIDRIKEVIFEFEMNQDGLYAKWEKYMALPQERKEKLLKQWDAYYHKCAESESGNLFWSLYSDFKVGNVEKIKEKSEKSKELRLKSKKILKPSSIDPEVLRRKMMNYFKLKSTLKELESVHKEYLLVYGKQKEVLESLD